MATIERTKNASRNIVVGVALKIYQIIIPFVMRTAMIYLLGIEFLGLNSLFTSVLQVLNLAELGVGSAMVYSMYKPISEDDNVTICALMKLYKTYYFVIGLVIAVVGTLITPFIPKLIGGDVPDNINIYILYLLNLGATVVSYWLFAYKNSIFQAHQRTDVVSKVTMITNTIQYIIQILVLWLFKDYYLYVIVLLLSQMLNNVVTAYFANKLYPQFKPKGQLDKNEVKQINQRIKDLFTSKVGSIVYDSADTIVISLFLGLTTLAVYQNYFYILSSVTAFISILLYSCTAGIGNSIIVETKEKNYKDFKKFTFILCWISCFCSCCLLALYQPFMQLWVGEELMLAYSCIVCLVIYFFVRQFNALFNLYKDASGMWHEDKWRPLAAAMTNLALNLLLVQFIGIYGVILSTVLAIILVGMPWLLHNIFSTIFEGKNVTSYLILLTKYVVQVLICCVLSNLICNLVNTSLTITITIRLLICCVIPNALFIVFNYRTEEFKESILLVDRMTKGKLKLSKLVS